jgi:hypothetical protein
MLLKLIYHYRGPEETLPLENQYWVGNFHDFENMNDIVHMADRLTGNSILPIKNWLLFQVNLFNIISNISF